VLVVAANHSEFSDPSRMLDADPISRPLTVSLSERMPSSSKEHQHAQLTRTNHRYQISSDRTAFTDLSETSVRQLGDRILSAFAGLFRSGFDTFSSALGRNLGAMAKPFGGTLRHCADFLSRMLNDMAGLGCSFVYVVGSILSNRDTYTEDK
jgi:hypothetical protein